MRISDWSSDVCSSDLYAGPSQRKDHEMAETIEQLRAINHGFDPDRGNWVHRGLDLSKPTELAPGEAEAFREHYATQFGHSLAGLDWWLAQIGRASCRDRVGQYGSI